MATRIRRWTGYMIIWILIFTAGSSWAQPEPNGQDRTHSPYFFIQSDDPNVDRLPLKSTSVKVNIVGVIADVTVSQVYENQGMRPIEAIYVFPASTRAAVYAMKMTVGERTVTAVIEKREEARRRYEQAKAEGKSASLLEQHRPNVFQMNVGNILPKDVIRVEMRYTELLVPIRSVYEFVYPTVVGPRYAGDQGDGNFPNERWIENPYMRQGGAPPYRFDASVRIAAGMPIQDVSCPSHKLHIQYSGPDMAQAALDPSEQSGGNRDLILRYRLSGSKVQTGLMLLEGEKENFFLLMAQPPERVAMEQVPPREYIFIVDVSGSMHGYPLDISKQLFKTLISGLRPADRFNVLLFAAGSSMLAERSLPATPENVRMAVDTIDHQRGSGGTQLLPALKKAMDSPKAEGYSRIVVIATDGYVAVETEAFDLIRQNLNRANVFAFGIGSSVNRFLIEGIARAGMGEPFVITNPETAKSQARTFQEMIERPVLTGIRIDYGDFGVYDIQPQTIPDIMAERPVVIFGKWRGKPKGSITLTGTLGSRPYTQKIPVEPVLPDKQNEALKYLWARHRIALLSDDHQLRPDDARTRKITQLGLSYSLLTAYTSFVAVDSRVRTEDGKVVTVRQPLPLPQGVSDLAVGGEPMAQAARKSLGPSMMQAGPYPIAREESKSADTTIKSGADKSEREKPGTTIDRLKVTDGLSFPTIRQILEAHLSQIESCLKRLREKSGSGGMKVALEIEIGVDGKVLNVKMPGPTKAGGRIETCLLDKMSAFGFPMPSTGKSETITLSLLLL
ncbi:MAG: trypsin [Desulfobacterales bacterium CG23_combo_of_CG06-09_8_20_14_all_52_9]|nr:MAG: trypsin [Desulfobacterales bacterium CG23_combo_of_CG06-09_8_20_14_all_52_9]